MNSGPRSITFTPDIWRLDGMDGVAPGVAYCAPPVAYDELLKIQQRSGLGIIGLDAPADLPLWSGDDLAGKRAILHQEGRIGDALIMTTFARALVEKYPSLRLTVASTNCMVDQVWLGNRYVGMMARNIGAMMPMEALQAFDYVIMPPHIGYLTRGTEESIYSQYARWFGFEDGEYTPRPYVSIAGMVRGEVRETLTGACFNANLPPDFFDRLVVVQISSQEPERSPQDWYDRLRHLSVAVGQRYHIAAFGDGVAMNEIIENSRERGVLPVYLFARHGGVMVQASTIALLTMIEAAHLVICPDSFGLHAAAAFDIPTIALWNLDPDARNTEGLPVPPPSARMATYENAIAIDMRTGPREVAQMAREALGV